MYLHIGQNEILPDRRVIGIFDLDKCSYGKRTREYLAAAEKEGVVLDVSGEIPKSFVVCDHPYHRQIVYLSQLNSTTLQKRAESGNLESARGGSHGGIYDTGKPSPLFILVHIPGGRSSGALSGGSVHGAAGPAAKLQQAPETAGLALCFWCTACSFCCCILPGWRCSPPSWLC